MNTRKRAEEKHDYLWKLYKEAHPETIGEIDQNFDRSNYIDWLEEFATLPVVTDEEIGIERPSIIEILLNNGISGYEFKYFSYNHNEALKEYKANDKYGDIRSVIPTPNSWEMPIELKEKYKVEKIGKIREIQFAPNGKVYRFKIGNKYAKTFYVGDFGVTVFPILSRLQPVGKTEQLKESSDEEKTRGK